MLNLIVLCFGRDFIIIEGISSIMLWKGFLVLCLCFERGFFLERKGFQQ